MSDKTTTMPSLIAQYALKAARAQYVTEDTFSSRTEIEQAARQFCEAPGHCERPCPECMADTGDPASVERLKEINDV